MSEIDFSPLRRLIGDGAIRPMPGGASTRRYFRVELRRPAGTTPAIAMFVPEGGKSEEIAKDGARRRWPFLEVRELLASRGIDVPAVYAEDTGAGWLVLEDLGDDTLAVFLERTPHGRRSLYTRAIEDLAHAQQRLADLPDDSIVRARAFDEDLLRWELDHFREWGLDARGYSLSPDDRAAYDEIAARLARRIAAWPRGFVHRDYQSRNLMVRSSGGEVRGLAWLDFQDALLGPRIYDVVALLGDSYQQFDRSFVLERLDEFRAVHGLPPSEKGALELELDVMTVQRKLKDAGRFVFIDRAKQNPSFLQFVVPTIRKVKAALDRLVVREGREDMVRLDALLGRALPAAEWG